jgi:hypothetical protein
MAKNKIKHGREMQSSPPPSTASQLIRDPILWISIKTFPAPDRRYYFSLNIGKSKRRFSDLGENIFRSNIIK